MFGREHHRGSHQPAVLSHRRCWWRPRRRRAKRSSGRRRPTGWHCLGRRPPPNPCQRHRQACPRAVLPGAEDPGFSIQGPVACSAAVELHGAPLPAGGNGTNETGVPPSYSHRGSAGEARSCRLRPLRAHGLGTSPAIRAPPAAKATLEQDQSHGNQGNDGRHHPTCADVRRPRPWTRSSRTLTRSQPQRPNTRNRRRRASSLETSGELARRRRFRRLFGLPDREAAGTEGPARSLQSIRGPPQHDLNAGQSCWSPAWAILWTLAELQPRIR